VDVTSKAFFMDSVFDMKLRLSRAPLPFPTVNEAVGLRAPDVDFQIKGGASGKKAFIDGFDHDIYGNLKAQPDTNNKPGVGVLTPSDTTTVLADSANINGTTDVVVDTNMFDPNAYVDEFIAAANRVYPNGSTISSATWGSVTDPWIVYCQGDVKITGTVKGYGILVVNGSLDISGGFTFTGLILVYKDSKIAVDETGGSGKDANIIGGLLMASPVSGSTFQMVGSQNIVYSKDALDLAKFASQLQWYTVVWWYETDRLFN
jgi:hypothetical protein